MKRRPQYVTARQRTEAARWRALVRVVGQGVVDKILADYRARLDAALAESLARVDATAAAVGDAIVAAMLEVLRHDRVPD